MRLQAISTLAGRRFSAGLTPEARRRRLRGPAVTAPPARVRRRPLVDLSMARACSASPYRYAAPRPRRPSPCAGRAPRGAKRARPRDRSAIHSRRRAPPRTAHLHGRTRHGSRDDGHARCHRFDDRRTPDVLAGRKEEHVCLFEEAIRLGRHAEEMDAVPGPEAIGHRTEGKLLASPNDGEMRGGRPGDRLDRIVETLRLKSWPTKRTS